MSRSAGAGGSPALLPHPLDVPGQMLRPSTTNQGLKAGGDHQPVVEPVTEVAGVRPAVGRGHLGDGSRVRPPSTRSGACARRAISYPSSEDRRSSTTRPSPSDRCSFEPDTTAFGLLDVGPAAENSGLPRTAVRAATDDGFGLLSGAIPAAGMRGVGAPIRRRGRRDVFASTSAARGGR